MKIYISDEWRNHTHDHLFDDDESVIFICVCKLSADRQ